LNVAIPAQSSGAASKDNTRGTETKQLDNGIGDTLVLDGATAGRRPPRGEGSNSTVAGAIFIVGARRLIKKVFTGTLLVNS
jgi:hypothetical protein